MMGDASPGIFQPALPMRGVTFSGLLLGVLVLFQPALPMRGVTAGAILLEGEEHISTRTPHAGSDRGGHEG